MDFNKHIHFGFSITVVLLISYALKIQYQVIQDYCFGDTLDNF